MNIDFSKKRINCKIKGIDYKFLNDNQNYKEKIYILDDVLVSDIDNFVSVMKEIVNSEKTGIEKFFKNKEIRIRTEHDYIVVSLNKNNDRSYIIDLKQRDLLKLDKTLKWRMFFTLSQLPEIIENWNIWRQENIL